MNKKINNKRKIATTSMAVLGVGLIVGGAFAALNDTLAHNENVTIEWVDIVDGSAANLALEDVNDVTNTPVTELTPGITYELTGTLENDSTVITNWVATDLTTTPGMSVTIADADGNDANNQVGEDVDVSQFGITIQVDQTVTPSTDLNFEIQFSSSDARVMLSEPTAISEIFPDPAMAACVASDDESPAAGDVNYVISQAELNQINKLVCTNKGINSMEGLQYMGELTYIDLSNNNITDLTPLSNLSKLTDLILGSNDITDVTPLQNLTSLKKLNLTGNSVTDITPLAGLTNLTTLYLTNNQISDVTPLSELTNLTTLYLTNNKISDTEPLTNLTNLKTLYLNGNNITDITYLSTMQNLTSFNLENNEITNFSSLAYQPDTFLAEQDPVTLPNTTLGTPTDVVIDGINGEDLIITFNTPGTYENGQLTWENPGVNSLTYASADGTITGTITQTVVNQ